VAKYVKRLKFNYPIAMATDEMIQKYPTDEGAPVTYIVSPTGKIVDVQFGIIDKAYLEKKIKALLPSVTAP